MDQLYFWTENPFVLEQNYLNVAEELVNDDGIPDVEEEKVKRVFLTVFPDQSELIQIYGMNGNMAALFHSSPRICPVPKTVPHGQLFNLPTPLAHTYQ
ncbi:MAG: hypothetical protein EZS28_019277 [Streblomastix strix]|uniref:Uncharacterized protein n=1 Tax=Streblomastix strix TaxID=222440 RepID=A0A5J4VRL7_9EUKA|nr:MAG: hypothetical protein EZS28_019277 [Streblomastix strix]